MKTITIEYGEVRGATATRHTGPFEAGDEVVITFSVPERNKGFTLGAGQAQTSDATMKLSLDGDSKPGSITSLSRNVQDPDKAAGDHKAVLTVDAHCDDVAVDLTVR